MRRAFAFTDVNLVKSREKLVGDQFLKLNLISLSFISISVACNY